MKKIIQLPQFFLLLFSLMSLFSNLSHAQALSTLFSSSEQRVYLDQLRLDYLAETAANNFDVDEVITEAADEEAISTTISYHLSAIISSGSKQRVVWLNDKAYYENELPDNMHLTTSGSELGLLIATATEEFILKPGQRTNIETGLIEESSNAEQVSQEKPFEENIEKQTSDLSSDTGPLIKETSTQAITEELPPALPFDSILGGLDPNSLEDPLILQALQVIQEAMSE